MAPSVRLRFDRDAPRYVGGEVISGTVTTLLDGAPPPDRLRLKLWWAARGKDAKRDHRSLFAEQDLSARADGTLPFQFTLPHTPLSWAGEGIQVHWTVSARLQWDGAQGDAVDSRDLVLLPGGETQPDIIRYADQISASVARVGRQEGRRLGLQMAVVFGALVFMQVLLGLALDSGSMGLRVGVAVVTALVLLGAWPVLFPAIAHGGKKRTAVQGLPEVLFLGGRYPVVLSGPAGEEIRWELQWVERDERTTRGGGAGDRAIRTQAWSAHAVRAAGGSFSETEERILGLPTAPASFVSPTRRIDWQLLVWVGDAAPEVHPLVVAPVLVQPVSR